jgi:hypothetical protein
MIVIISAESLQVARIRASKIQRWSVGYSLHATHIKHVYLDTSDTSKAQA